MEERFAALRGRDDTGMLGDCGSSITIRLEVCTTVSINLRFTDIKQWPDYRSWNHQVSFAVKVLIQA
jgi:hypothetical protein